jgi:predicted dinucleotide-utilizing enzyme
MPRPHVGWLAKDSQDNATATATKAALTGKQHVIYSVSASFSATAANKLVQLKDGTTVIWEGYVTDNGREFTFPKGIGIARGAACSATLAASGAGGTIGKLNLHGETI